MLKRLLAGFVALMTLSDVACAANIIGPVSTSLTSISLGATISVDITAIVTDVALIDGSVLLQRINPDGSISILGQLHDDGFNGDVSPNDKTYSIRLPITGNVPGPLVYRISAAFKGALKRTTSTAFGIYVVPPTPPEAMLFQLADELTAGDIAGALTHFPVGDRHAQQLKTMPNERRMILADSFRTAKLFKTDGSTQIYSVVLSSAKTGISVPSKIGIAQMSSGAWMVMFW